MKKVLGTRKILSDLMRLREDLQEELVASLTAMSNVLKDIEEERANVFSEFEESSVKNVFKDNVTETLTELIEELDGKLIKSNGNTILFTTDRDEFLLEPQSFLIEKDLFGYTDMKKFSNMGWNTNSLKTDLNMSVDELKEELSNTIRMIYEEMVYKHFENHFKQKPADIVFLINIEPSFVTSVYHENSAQLAHLRYYFFAKEKN